MRMHEILALMEATSAVATLKGANKIVRDYLYALNADTRTDVDDGYVNAEVEFFDDVDPEKATAIARHLDSLLQPRGWFLGKIEIGQRDARTDQFARLSAQIPFDPARPVILLLFALPLLGKQVKRVPDIAYHLTTPDRVETIKREGLTPSTGGSDFITTPQPRVYLIFNETMIQWVANDFRRNRRVKDLVLVRVNPRGLGPFYKDPEWEDGCVWTANTITASSITGIERY